MESNCTVSRTNGIRTKYTINLKSIYSQTLIKREYEKNIFGAYTEEISSTSYTYGLGLISERRDTGEEYYYHYNHLGSTMAVSDGSGEVIYRFVYSTYGELYDIKDGNGNSLGNIAASEGYTYAEMAHALGMEYLYNGQYGVSTDIDGLYYMRARYYDQIIKRFINRDVLSGDIGNSQSMNRFSYVQGNPVSLTDPFGLCPDGNSAIENLVIRVFSDASGIINTMAEKPTVSWKDVGRAGLGLFGIGGDPVTSIKQLCAYALAVELDWSKIGHTFLGVVGIVWDGADLINAAWYFHEENYEMAAVSMLCALPFVGTLVGGSAGLALKVIGKGFTLGFAAEGAFESISRAVDAYENGTLSWWNALDVGFNTLGFGLAAGGFKGTFGDALAGKTEPGIWKGFKPLAADNRGCVDLEALREGKSKSNHGKVSGSSTELISYYPSNNDAVAGTERKVYLMAGEKIDRFGGIKGKYFSPTGTPMEMRALPYDADLLQYRQFVVVKPFEVEASTIAPAFGKIGLGTQYRSPVSVEVLLKKGIIKQIGGN